MIIPVRCFSCGFVVGSAWLPYLDLLAEGNLSEGEALDKLRVRRYCCRRMILSNVDLMQKLIGVATKAPMQAAWQRQPAEAVPLGQGGAAAQGGEEMDEQAENEQQEEGVGNGAGEADEAMVQA